LKALADEVFEECACPLRMRSDNSSRRPEVRWPASDRCASPRGIAVSASTLLYKSGPSLGFNRRPYQCRHLRPLKWGTATVLTAFASMRGPPWHPALSCIPAPTHRPLYTFADIDVRWFELIRRSCGHVRNRLNQRRILHGPRKVGVQSSTHPDLTVAW